MNLTTHPELEQGTEEWLAVRKGMVTASVIGQLITPGTLKTASNDYSRGLIASLVAERITGHIEPVFINADMWRGIEDEPRARAKYAEVTGQTVAEMGFMVLAGDGWEVGYSPDGLVGDDGLIEIKSRRQKKHLQTILADRVPAENMAQIQCGLLVSGRKWCDYISYCGGMPMWVRRVMPDVRWQAAILEAAYAFEKAAVEMVADYRKAIDGLAVTERAVEMEMI